MKYGDRIIEMRGIIVKIEDGAVEMDLKGRLGFFKVPMRMLITDYALKIGQEVAFMMSFPEVISEVVDEKYLKNIEKKEN